MKIVNTCVVLAVLLLTVLGLLSAAAGQTTAETILIRSLQDRLQDQARVWRYLMEATENTVASQEAAARQTAKKMVTVHTKASYELIDHYLDWIDTVPQTERKRAIANELLDRLARYAIGKSGYVWILDYKGSYVLSKNRARDGENIWDSKDSDGNLFVQNLIRKGRALHEGETDYHSYPWKNQWETSPREKIAALLHFPRMEWVVGISTYYDDLVDMSYRAVTMERIKNLIAQQRIGKSGYIWVTDSAGVYQVSEEGLRNGEDISGARDANGALFIQEAIRKAKDAGVDTAIQEYSWQNIGESKPRMKVAGLAYMEAWDWIIGVSAYYDDFSDEDAAGMEKGIPDKGEPVPGVTDTEILIGSSAALGGHASFLGSQLIEGARARINEVNEQGGIYGRTIRLVAYDDRYDPSKTVANTRKLINEDKVFALFNYVGTPTTKAIVVNETPVSDAKIPLVGLFTGAEFLRTPFQPYVFNVRDSYYAEAEGAVTYFTSLGLKKIAVMYQNDAFGRAVLDGAKIALKKRGMKPVAIATFERGTMDVEKAMERIKASGAEAVVMVGTYSPLAKFIKISHDAGFSPYFHTVSFVGSEAFGKELIETQKISPEYFRKIIVTQVVPAPFSGDYAGVREYRQLAKEYNPRHEENYVALEGFINAGVLVKALRKAGRNLTREKFIFALESMRNVDIGIGKLLTFGNNDHQGLTGIYYSRLTSEGVFEIFTPLM